MRKRDARIKRRKKNANQRYELSYDKMGADSYKLRTLFSRTIKKREGKGGRRGATIVTG